MEVVKRNGKREVFDPDKISTAIDKAYYQVYEERCDMCPELTATVEEILDGHDTTVDDIQRTVENVLMDAQLHDVARSYIEYRHDRDRARVMMPTEAISDYTTVAKYSAYNGDRREVFVEIAGRCCGMHQRRFPAHEKQIARAFGLVDEKRVLPSMRSMQFGGPAIEANHCRIYNCSFTHINRLRVFGEIFYVLLSGCGVGYSVQFQHVDMLPRLSYQTDKVRHITIEDTIEGWGDAVNELIRCYFVTGETPEFNYSLIRPKGSPLKTSGGRAPGHLPLKRALELVQGILHKAQGRKLLPIECYDMICHLADAVLAGGIRRSSCICLFSLTDYMMMTAKSHGNFVPNKVNPQRAMSNNSAVCIRGQVTYDEFVRLVETSKEWGDPGFYFTDDPDIGTNPCAEIGMLPILANGWDGVDRTLDYGWKQYDGRGAYTLNAQLHFSAEVYGHNTGFQFCNLCEINGAKIKNEDDFREAVEAATLIGTMQATYTDFPYLGPVTEAITKNEALLGVGLTGIMDNPEICLDSEILARMAEHAVTMNQVWAETLGIRPAARVTTVKPGGTAPLVLGCVGSGSTPHHAPRYFRRVTANPLEYPAQFFRSKNPHMVEVKENGDWVITFCVTAPEDAVTLDQVRDVDHMDMIFTLYDSWVKPGSKTSFTHNVSCTVVVDDWDAVIKKAWDEQYRIAAMSFFARGNDKIFPHAPREAVVTKADEQKWIALCESYTPVDWTEAFEETDTTDRAAEIACGGGACEI